MRHGFDRLVLVVIAGAILAGSPWPATAQADYTPPIGIPVPPFGIDQSHMMYDGQLYQAGGFVYRDAGNGPYTHYVDNTHPSATNTGNPYGTASLPRMDIFDGSSVTLPAGSVVEIHGGPYIYSASRTITSQGTAAKPVFVRAISPNAVQIQGAYRNNLTAAGSYMIVENLEFYHGMAVYAGSSSNHIAVRYCQVHNDPSWRLSGGSAMYAGTYATDVVFYQNHIHDNWKANGSGTVQDSHGVNVGSGAQRVWVLENHIHDNSGDAFQGAHYASPAPRYVYVGGNLMHDDRENGVDLKTIHDVVVSQNVMYGYQASSTSIGDAVVVGSNGVTPGQYGPIRAWLLFNDIRDSQTGIRVEGANDCWIVGNTIHDTSGNGVQFDIDPDSTNINVIGNTIVSAGGGIVHGWQDGASGFTLENNILSMIGGRHVDLSAAIAATSTVSNNLFWDGGSSVSVRMGGNSYTGTNPAGINNLPGCSGNVIGDPLFVNLAGDNYRIQAGSAAIDVGFESACYQTFVDLYGLDIRVDYDGLPRPQGNGWDIGAFEYVNPVVVVGRHVFYNNSAFDGNDAAAGAADDGAIAPDKQPLVVGQTATFANYTSYSKGINGIMVDIAGLSGVPTAADFELKVGNDSAPAGWGVLGTTPTIAVRSGAGTAGADRVTIILPDGTVTGEWLEVTVKATANTGITSGDVFYFGNAIGETGNSASDAEVTPTDEVSVRQNPHTLGVSPAGITEVCDFNRDRKVGPTDQVLCRNNGTSGPTALQLIVLVPNQPPTVDAGSGSTIDLSQSVSLDGTVGDDGYPNPPGAATTTWSKISGPGTVTFGDPNAVDTTATFSTEGTYVLQLEAYDGEKSATDTVQIVVVSMEVLFEDDFDDNDLAGWTILEGTFETFQYLAEPGYEVHVTTDNSRMRADLISTSLSDDVRVSFKTRHTGGTGGSGDTGLKSGRLWFVDDSGVGFGLYFALQQSGDGNLQLVATNNDGNTQTSTLGTFTAPGGAGGNELKQIELYYDRVNDQVQCFYEGVSMGTIGISSAYRNFTRLVVSLSDAYYEFVDPPLIIWGQLDVDDVLIYQIVGA